jgi:hypothetical protein
MVVWFETMTKTANEALLRTGTRPVFRRGLFVSFCGGFAANEKCQVPVAEVGRSMKRATVKLR